MKKYRVGNPNELVDILIGKGVKEVTIDVLGCFGLSMCEWQDNDIKIERHEKELVVANSVNEELRFPIDYIISATAITSEDEFIEITMDPTYIVKMLKAEVVKDLEQYVGFNKTQEVWHKLRKMREELGE